MRVWMNFLTRNKKQNYSDVLYEEATSFSIGQVPFANQTSSNKLQKSSGFLGVNIFDDDFWGIDKHKHKANSNFRNSKAYYLFIK